MKISIEYPKVVYTDRDPEVFHDITMFDLSFPTTIHYFKNHDREYEQLLIVLLGFGIRLTKEETKK